MKSETVYFFIIRYLKIVKMSHERTSLFQVMEKMREKRKKRYKKNSMNEFIYYDG